MNIYRLALFFFLASWCLVSTSQTLNGFDLSNLSVPLDAIDHGGPPRDGIPAIYQPKYLPADKANFLRPDDRVLGFSIDGIYRAYPIFILNWHELVNSEINKQPYLISYCPLCGTGMAFSSMVHGQHLQFGVSGLLYSSDVLFYDRQSDSLWSQIHRRAISGKWLGESLEQLPLEHTTWKKWREKHPQTQVLSNRLGYKREYRNDPYRGYEKSKQLFFKVAHKIPKEYHPKERVLGLIVNGKAKAYPFAELRKQGQAIFMDEFNGQSFQIRWDQSNNSAHILDLDGKPIVTTIAFWFAWYAFYPETKIFRYHQ